MRSVTSSVCSTNIPKLLGCYEAELHPVFAKWQAVPFRQVVNVGAAEGYYAVGCARLWPEAQVIAFETNPGRKGSPVFPYGTNPY